MERRGFQVTEEFVRCSARLLMGQIAGQTPVYLCIYTSQNPSSTKLYIHYHGRGREVAKWLRWLLGNVPGLLMHMSS